MGALFSQQNLQVSPRNGKLISTDFSTVSFALDSLFPRVNPVFFRGSRGGISLIPVGFLAPNSAKILMIFYPHFHGKFHQAGTGCGPIFN